MATSAGRRRSGPHPATLAAVALLLAALALRLAGILFARTAPLARPDEDIFIIEGLRLFGRLGDTSVAADNLQRGWPAGFFLIVHLIERLEALLLARPGLDLNLACLYALDPTAVAIGPRLFSALAGTAACLATGLSVRRLAPAALRPWALPIGIAALGFNYLAGRDAHFGVSDATLLAAIAFTLYFLVRATQDGPGWLPAAGLGAGTALAIKFAAAPLSVPCVLTAVAVLREARADRRAAIRGMVGMTVGAILGFALLSPWALALPVDLGQGFASHGDRFTEDGRAFLIDRTVAAPRGWRFYPSVVLPAAFGWVGLLGAIAGLSTMARWNRATALVVGVTAVAFFASIAPAQMIVVRYASPMLAPLAVALGCALLRAIGWAHGRWPGPRGALAAVAVVAASLGPPAWRLVEFDRLLRRADTRELAGEWLAAQGPGTTLLAQGGYPRIHALDESAIAACRSRVHAGSRPILPARPGRSADWPALVRRGRAAWAELATAAIWPPRSPPAESARFVSQSRMALPCGRIWTRADMTAPDPRCFDEVAAFTPGLLDCDAIVDLYDWFQAPFSAFGGAERPGPEIRIFRNRCIAR